MCVCDSLATDSGLAHSVSSWPFRHVGKLGCRSPGRSTVSASSLIILKRVVWAAVLLPALSPLFSEHILSTYSTILASCFYLLSVFLFVDHCFRSFCAILLFALSSFRLHPAFKNYFRNNSHSVDWITGRAFTYVFMFCFVILFTLIFFVALSFRFLSVINWYHIFIIFSLVLLSLLCNVVIIIIYMYILIIFIGNKINGIFSSRAIVFVLARPSFLFFLPRRPFLRAFRF